MCELLGFSAAEPEDIREQLEEFFSHSVRHPHGWGLMYGDRLVKECGRACDSDALSRILKRMQPTKTLLGHIRFATVGSIKLENCHPFVGRDVTGRQWTLIHNGTIYSGNKLIPYLNSQTGDTDSERLFLYLLDTLGKAQQNGELSAEERCRLLEDLVQDIAPRNKLNLMIYDGELMYIHRNMENTLKFRRLGSGYIVSTTELDGGDWQDVPMAQLTAYRDGECVFTGKPHDGIFVPTLQYIQAMHAMHI